MFHVPHKVASKKVGRKVHWPVLAVCLGLHGAKGHPNTTCSSASEEKHDSGMIQALVGQTAFQLKTSKQFQAQFEIGLGACESSPSLCADMFYAD